MELPAVPIAVLREALGAWPDEVLDRLAARIATAPDPEGALGAAAAIVDAEIASRRGGHRLPESALTESARALASLLANAGATDAWLRGERSVAGWGRLRRRYPALTALAGLTARDARGDDADPVSAAGARQAPPEASSGGRAEDATSGTHAPTTLEDPAVERACELALLGDPAAEEPIAAVEAALGGPWLDGLLLRADLAEAAGRIDEARALLDRAVALAPTRPDASLIRADLEAFEGDDEAALRALEPWSRHPLAIPRRAAALLRLGRVSQAAALGVSPTTHVVQAPSVEAAGAPSLDALLDGEPHARAAALHALGHGDEHARALAAMMADGEATEREVLALARFIASGGDSPTGVAIGTLATQVLASTGAALPGASGLEAAESAALASALLDRAGRSAEAAEARAVRRQVLDRTLQEGGAGPALGAALMDAAAEALEQGSAIAWSGRRSWILRSLRAATAEDAALLDAAARLVRALATAASPDARAVADAALALLPMDDAGVDVLPAPASRAAFRLLAADVGADAAVSDPRFQHAASRRVATARELAGAGRLEEAATIAAAMLRKPLLAEERAALVAVLVGAANAGADEARAALAREAAGIADLAAGDRLAAAASLAAMARLKDAGTLRTIHDRLLRAWKDCARYPRVAAAAADVLGRAASVALGGGDPEPARAMSQPLLEASPYLLARAIVAGRAGGPRIPPRSPLPLPLLDAVRTGAPLLELARQLRRRNWDPSDLPALLTA